MILIDEEWQFNVLNILNFRRENKLSKLFLFLEQNYEVIPGGIAEFGVYRGSQLLSIAYFMKSLGSRKRVWGFDTFEGFPSNAISSFDDFSKFHELYSDGKLNEWEMAQISRYAHLKELLGTKHSNVETISSSGNFSSTSKDAILNKINLLGLENTYLVDGEFDKLQKFDGEDQFMLAIIDADLYSSYIQCLDFLKTRMALGGLVFLDEYFSLKFPGPRFAVDKFLSENTSFQLEHFSNSYENYPRYFLRKI